MIKGQETFKGYSNILTQTPSVNLGLVLQSQPPLRLDQLYHKAGYQAGYQQWANNASLWQCIIRIQTMDLKMLTITAIHLYK